MRKRLLFTLPLTISCLTLFSCNDGKVTKLNASISPTDIYKRGGSISKDKISVYAELSSGGQKEVKSSEWTSTKFGKSDTYTFTASGENVIDIKYGDVSTEVKISVRPKGSVDFVFKDYEKESDVFTLNVGETKTVEISMKEEGAEADVSEVKWSIGDLSLDKDSILITPDTTNKFKCSIKGVKKGGPTIDAKITDTTGDSSHTHSLTVDVKDPEPGNN